MSIDFKNLNAMSSKFTTNDKVGDLILAGRFGQWKYYWTDDCVLRGKYISEAINYKKQ